MSCNSSAKVRRVYHVPNPGGAYPDGVHIVEVLVTNQLGEVRTFVTDPGTATQVAMEMLEASKVPKL